MTRTILSLTTLSLTTLALSAAATAADLDGDGIDDIVMGSPYHPGSGHAYVQYIDADGRVDEWAGLPTPSLDADAKLGAAIATGDFDCDGDLEVAVSAPRHEGGRVFVLNQDGREWSLQHTLHRSALDSQGTEARFGTAVTVGDFDGDGCDDLSVGAPRGEIDGTRAGVVYMYAGSEDGLEYDRGFRQAWGDLGENRNNDRFGETLAAFDFNADGMDELLVGAPHKWVDGLERAGKVYVYRGTGAGVHPLRTLTANDGNAQSATNGRFGQSLGVHRISNGAMVLIGSPKAGCGAVDRFSFRNLTNTHAPFRLSPAHWDHSCVAGDEFGAAIAVENHTSRHVRYLIGAPGTDTEDGQDAGHVYSRGEGNQAGKARWTAFDALGTASDGARFGESLASTQVAGTRQAFVASWNHGTRRVEGVLLESADLELDLRMAVYFYSQDMATVLH